MVANITRPPPIDPGPALGVSWGFLREPEDWLLARSRDNGGLSHLVRLNVSPLLLFTASEFQSPAITLISRPVDAGTGDTDGPLPGARSGLLR